MLRSLLAAALVCSAGFAADDKKDDKKDEKDFAKLIVGKWEITKAGGDVGPGSTLEFGKDKKLVMVVKDGDNKATVKGAYEVKKDKLTITLTAGENEFEQTLTIKKLTDESLELVDDKGGVDVLKKLKQKD